MSLIPTLPAFWQTSQEEQVADRAIRLLSDGQPDYGKTQAPAGNADLSFSRQDIKTESTRKVHKQ